MEIGVFLCTPIAFCAVLYSPTDPQKAVPLEAFVFVSPAPDQRLAHRWCSVNMYQKKKKG